MAEKPLSFVSLLATGPSPGEDEVLEAAAVRWLGGREAKRFCELARPAQLPLAIQRLTGLSEARLSGRPAPRKVLEGLQAFLGSDTVVVHGAEAFASFLAAAGLPEPAVVLDSRLLARIVRPEATDYSLPALAAEFGLAAPPKLRALELARLTAALWDRLMEGLKNLPGPALDVLHRVAGAAACPLARVLAEAANRKAGFELSAEPGLGFGEVLPDHRELFARAQRYESPRPRDEPVDTDRICEMFSPAGAIGRNLPGYEHRPEQVQMVREVCDAFNEGRHLMFEAGTGTGKSMAYLLPAIAWARQNEDKVVVSTNTKNLQVQLYRKDLPFLRELLGGRFDAALLKGRRNYLCVRRLLHLVRYFDRELGEPGEMTAMLPLIAWASRTESGDLAECTGLLVDESAAAIVSRVTTGGDECAGRACRVRSQCFVRRARTLAQLADLIVVNHALLFAEVGMDQPYLPLERCLIFDEAQNVEDVATEALGVTADALSVFRVTNRLWRARRDGSGSGMIATVIGLAQRRLPESGPAAKQTVMALARSVIEHLDDVVAATRQCFETLAEPFESVPAYVDKILLRDCYPPVDEESSTGQAAQKLEESVHKLCGRIEALAQALEQSEERLDAARELAGDLRAQLGRLKEARDALKFILAREHDRYVYWLQREQRGQQTFYALRAAPLEIGTLMRGYFFDPLRCVILTSATMRVGGNFRYMRERLGADDLSEETMRCAAVGSSFDYDRQVLLCVPTFLPEAGGRRQQIFDEELASFLIDLLQATRGRALVLFTSYSLLNGVYERIKGPLERAGLLVLAQGRGGSRETLTALFRSITGSVLLGTQSFWEGVDIPGESLSCLVLTKLPFHVYTEPLVQGRIEYLRDRGVDPFRHYTLPEAVVGFRQGFGRLIRNRTDRGVVVVTDRRLVTKHYGRAFLRDVPTRARIFKDRAPLLRAVSRFFGEPH